MERDFTEENEDLPVGTYKKIMSDIEFMQSYMEEPDVFKPDSPSLKQFLIKSFSFLHPDFHYLAFVGKDVDVEIKKISHMLQILPTNLKMGAKLFDNMDKADMNKFWLRFFTLFTKQNEFNINSMFNASLENEVNFFKDIKSTLNYINYDIPILHANKFNTVKITAEIDSWKQPVANIIHSYEERILFNTDEEQTIDVHIEKLITDLKHVESMYNNIVKPTSHQNSPENNEYFINFIGLTENVLQYKNHLTIISCPLLDEINFKMLSNYKDLSGNLYYIKRCNNFVRALKSKIKSLI